jgi:hypothetical protein
MIDMYATNRIEIFMHLRLLEEQRDPQLHYDATMTLWERGREAPFVLEYQCFDISVTKGFA